LSQGELPHETLPHDLLLGMGDNTAFGGHRPLKIWEGKKRPKLAAIYDSF